MLLISNTISRGDFDSLKDLVQSSSIEAIKQNYARLSDQQKQSIAVKKEDIQMRTLHLFENVSPENTDDLTYVKIGLLFQIVPGFSSLLEESKRNPNSFIELSRRLQTDLIVADYQYAVLKLTSNFNVDFSNF